MGAIVAVGAILLIIGIIFTQQGVKQKLSVGKVRGAAGPVLIIVGAALILLGLMG